MTADSALVRAQALADPTRATILRLLQEAEEPRTASDLAEAVGVHRTSAAHHLGKLRDVGLVREITLHRPGRGRPRTGYVALVDADAPPYRALATMLADVAATGDRPRDVGRRAGQAVGQRVRSTGATDPVDAIVTEVAAMGFSPDPVAGSDGHVDVVLRTCAFADVAAEHPAMVCGLHLGLAEGIAEEIGGVTVDGLTAAHPHEAGCHLRLRRQPPPG